MTTAAPPVHPPQPAPPAHPALLIILDGFGLREETRGNAIAQAKMPHLKGWLAQGHAKLEASGLAVGVPRGAVGNSEVGHLAIGAGQVLFQSLARISLAIEQGQLPRNLALTQAIDASKGHTLHLIGLLSDGGVHSHIDHLLALLDLCALRGQTKVYVHPILDGRDTPPKEAAKHLDTLQRKLDQLGFGKIADLGGRFFAMDRDTRWDRVQQAVDCMALGKAPQAATWREALDAAYAQGQTDEFLRPTRLQPGKFGLLQQGDHILLFNFRPDRMRELTRALADPGFKEFPRPLGPWRVTTMTPYDATFTWCPVAFPPEEPRDTLGEVVARAGGSQLRIAETEKYAHVTYFFNGGREEPFAQEERILVPSRRDQPTYDLAPEMSARGITDALLPKLAEAKHQLIVLNFANPDMCGHTGNLAATIRGCDVVDECLGRIVPLAREQGYEVFITADHGNAEVMEVRGEPHKAHTMNPVPLVYIGARAGAKLRDGGLSDVAPTVLDAMGLPKPAAMTGTSLFA